MSLHGTTDLAAIRQQAHAFLDRLSIDKLTAVHGLLETIVDPAIPIDDEPETEAERQAVAAALESLDRNGGVSMDRACRLRTDSGGF